MTPRYSRTQMGWVIIAIVLIAVLVLVYVLIFHEFLWIRLTVAIGLVSALVLFASLTVVGYETYLEIRFGIGLVRKRFVFKDIQSCKKVRNSWAYGFGIRIIPGGWLYNVSGLDAVELQMKDGKKYRIGTDVPDELMRFLQQKIGI
ncbi:MAG: hypothetical protein WBD28_06315 [Candidatus Zixiibacteriota bacterium]